MEGGLLAGCCGAAFDSAFWTKWLAVSAISLADSARATPSTSVIPEVELLLFILADELTSR